MYRYTAYRYQLSVYLSTLAVPCCPALTQPAVSQSPCVPLHRLPLSAVCLSLHSRRAVLPRTDTACSQPVTLCTVTPPTVISCLSVTAAGCVLRQTPVLPAVTPNVTARLFFNLFNEVVSTRLFRYEHNVMYNELETVEATFRCVLLFQDFVLGVWVLRILWGQFFVFLITMAIEIK